MSTNNDSLLQREQSSYQRLTAVASDLNTVSDELGKVINALDESLKRLNLGIAQWHKFAGNEHESGAFWANAIGYAKIGTRWGIGLSKVSGHNEAPELSTDEEWLFNDAPRQLRIEAVEHIPAMIDALIEAAEKTVEKIKTKTAEAQKLADMLATPVPKPKSVPRSTPVQRSSHGDAKP